MEGIVDIASRIFQLPGRPLCILDRDLAGLYDQPTGEINRITVLYPRKFTRQVFLLTKAEAQHPDVGWKRGHLPHAFTSEGALQLAGVLNTEIAVSRYIDVNRAFGVIGLLSPGRSGGSAGWKSMMVSEDLAMSLTGLTKPAIKRLVLSGKISLVPMEP